MKRKFYCLVMVAILFLLPACGSEETSASANSPDAQPVASDVKEETEKESPKTDGEVDVDLTQLSSTMVYSEVYNMMVTPDDYVGKTIKMSGQFSAYQDQSTGNNYYSVIISDATACCSQGLEFVLEDENYPEQGEEITVVGEFQTYKEGEYLYCRLVNAELCGS